MRARHCWPILLAAMAAISCHHEPTPAVKPLPPELERDWSVVVDDAATTPRLIVPRTLVMTLTADAGAVGAEPEWVGASWPGLFVIGLGLAGSLTLASFRWPPARKTSGLAILVLATLCALTGASGWLWADLPVPPGQEKPDRLRRFVEIRDPVSPGIRLADCVEIEVTDKSEVITLVVPRERLADVAKQANSAR